MSTDNPTLFDYNTSEARQKARSQTLETIGAVYGRTERKDDHTGSPEVSRDCENCGHRVSPRYARVMSDNQGVLHCCYQCVDRADMLAGAGAGRVRR